MTRPQAYALPVRAEAHARDARGDAYPQRAMSTVLPAAEIAYTVRRSARARRVRVNVHADARVEVVLPARAPERAAAAAVSELRPWIEQRVDRARRSLALAQQSLAERAGTLPYLGSTLQLVPQAGRTRVHRSGERLLVPAGDSRAALERFYRRAARAEIGERLDRASTLAGASYSGLDIRAQRTRWASCSSTGRMSFNWRLLLAPERVLDYVVWHEVCHLHVADHSPRFWALVERYWPDYRSDRDWLRRNGATLVI
jgi:predicted metal-dependent hydrolase